MNLSTVDQEEIDNSFNQASIGLILRVWEEVSKLFLDFIQNSPHSPFKLLKAIFGRREYQSESGNVAHSHIILAIDWPNLSDDEKKYVENLARGSIFDVVRSHEIDEYIEKKFIRNVDDVDSRIDDASLFLSHKCSNRCLVKTSTGKLRCRMPRYCQLTPDNTRPMFIDVPSPISDQCWERLHKIGLANPLYDENGEKIYFSKVQLNFFIQNVGFHQLYMERRQFHHMKVKHFAYASQCKIAKD